MLDRGLSWPVLRRLLLGLLALGCLAWLMSWVPGGAQWVLVAMIATAGFSLCAFAPFICPFLLPVTLFATALVFVADDNWRLGDLLSAIDSKPQFFSALGLVLLAHIFGTLHGVRRMDRGETPWGRPSE